MILWIQAQAADMPSDQRAELLASHGDMLWVRLKGTGTYVTCKVDNVIKVELSDQIALGTRILANATTT